MVCYVGEYTAVSSQHTPDELEYAPAIQSVHTDAPATTVTRARGMPDRRQSLDSDALHRHFALLEQALQTSKHTVTNTVLADKET